MTVTAAYLNKIRYSVRRNSSTLVDSELTDLIEECRADLQRLGVSSAKATSETDYLTLGAVRSFVRWRFGLSNEDAEQNKNDYLMQVDELRRMRDYAYYTVTFTVKTSGAVAIADVYVQFNGETKQTNSSGVAAFYYVSAGVNQEYVIYKEGYVTQEVDLDVSGDTAVAVTLIAG